MFEAPLFQDSERTITSAEINDILYESRVDFHGDDAKNNNKFLKKLDLNVSPVLANN